MVFGVCSLFACSKPPAAGADFRRSDPDAGSDAGVTLQDAGEEAGGDAGDAGDAGIDGGPSSDGGILLPALTGTLTSTTFTVAEHMRAAIEMQLSGEPFAQLLGYNLRGFNRTLPVTDQVLWRTAVRPT